VTSSTLSGLRDIPVKLSLPSKSVYLLRFSAVLSYCRMHFMYTVNRNGLNRQSQLLTTVAC